MLATDIDQLDLHLADGFQLAVKAIVALFLFGIALDTKIGDFRDVARRPWVIVAGLVAQYAVMPGLTVLLTLALDVRGSVAIGMILVVCCPAGNLSNILTHRSRGDVALSVSLTAVSTIAAVVVTPVALAFWCGLNPAADDLLRDVHIDPWDMVAEAVLLIGLPFALGILIAWRRPSVSERARKIVEPAALTLLLLIVVGGLAGQFGTFLDYIGVVAVAIVLQNALSLLVGYAHRPGDPAPRVGRARDDARAGAAQHRPGPGARARLLRRARRRRVRRGDVGPVGRHHRPDALDLVAPPPAGGPGQRGAVDRRSTCGMTSVA